MCGIAGFSGSMEGRTIERMLHAMAHRGPDDCGIFRSPCMTLGHKRLAIIDLSPVGRQPMSDPEGVLKLVFNGEIYNYQSLRRELENRYPFQTRTDTETILAAYRVFGREAFLSRLEGMFALALYTSDDNTLLLARDPMGIKPLYWAAIPGGIAFASELRSLLKHPHVSREPAPEVLSEYLLQRYVHNPRTAVKEVFKLTPGTRLLYQNGKISQSHFYTPSFSIRYAYKDKEEACQELGERLQEAVKRHLVADVPVGLMLSAGIDSSVMALAAAKTENNLKTFTIGFMGASDNEFGPARRMAERLNADHTEIILAPVHLDMLPLVAFENDEPVAGPSSLAYHLALAEARKSCKVVLFGHGADELFSGYEQVKILKSYKLLKRVPLAALFARAVAGLIGGLFPQDGAFQRLNRFLNAADDCTAYHLLMAVSSPEETSGLLWSRDKAPIPESLKEAFLLERDLEIASIRYEQGGWLSDDILHRVDRMTMAHAIEGRVPYLDPKVVEFANSLCPSLKFRSMQGKYILRRAFEKELPPEVTNRRKRRFNTPVDHFFGPAFNRMAHRLFTTKHLLTRHLFDPEGLAALLDYRNQPSFRLLLRHNKLAAQYFARQIWTIVTYMFWFFTVMEGIAPSEVAERWCRA